MRHADTQTDPEIMYFYPGQQSACAIADREAIINRATTLYLMGELAAAAALFLQLAVS